jgi:hypothetical protein
MDWTAFYLARGGERERKGREKKGGGKERKRRGKVQNAALQLGVVSSTIAFIIILILFMGA